MEDIVIALIPSLAGQTTLLMVVSVLFYCFFGSLIYSFIASLFGGFRK